jgi:hypothetical protein
MSDNQHAFHWSDWTNEQYPATEYKFDDFHAIIKLAVPKKKNNPHNRQWTVKRRDIVIGSGFTYGTKTAQNLCEMILCHEGVMSSAQEFAGMSA